MNKKTVLMIKYETVDSSENKYVDFLNPGTCIKNHNNEKETIDELNLLIQSWRKDKNIVKPIEKNKWEVEFEDGRKFKFWMEHTPCEELPKDILVFFKHLLSI